MTEPFEARLARIEEKLDGLFQRLSERSSSNTTRLDGHDKTIARFGERIGKLEAEHERHKGGKAVVIGLLSGGGIAGGLLVKVLEWLSKSGG